MILTANELRTRIDCGELLDADIEVRLKAIEKVIRKYTGNNFQNRDVRFVAKSMNGNQLERGSNFLRVNNTVQITQSKVNDGLYTILCVDEDCITVDGELFDIPNNKVTKVEYPEDVKQCAADLFEWKQNFGSKVGIKSESETLSRHSESVTYEDSSTLFMGFPVGILNGLSLHKKARF